MRLVAVDGGAGAGKTTFAARLAVASRLCYAIWIAAAPELRLARGIARDTRDVAGKSEEELRKIWEGFMPGEKAFFEADGTEGRADLRVDGSKAYGSEGPEFYVILSGRTSQ